MFFLFFFNSKNLSNDMNVEPTKNLPVRLSCVVFFISKNLSNNMNVIFK